MGGHSAASEEGPAKGVTRGSRGGSAADTGRQTKGAWEGDEDDWGGGGGEKGKGGWGRGRGKGGWKGGRIQKKKSSLMDGFDDDVSPDFVPYKKKTFTKTYNKVIEPTSIYTQPDQKLRGTDTRLGHTHSGRLTGSHEPHI